MLKTKYDVLVKNGKERFVIVPEKDFKELRDQLEDESDFRTIEESKRRNAGKRLIPFDQVKSELAVARRGKKKT